MLLQEQNGDYEKGLSYATRSLRVDGRLLCVQVWDCPYYYYDTAKVVSSDISKVTTHRERGRRQGQVEREGKERGARREWKRAVRQPYTYKQTGKNSRKSGRYCGCGKLAGSRQPLSRGELYAGASAVIGREIGRSCLVLRVRCMYVCVCVWYGHLQVGCARLLPRRRSCSHYGEHKC